MRLLFSCLGRRIELLRSFVHAGRELEISLEVHGSDGSDMAPGLHFCDYTHQVPPIEEDHYVPALLDIVRSRGIDLLIPLLDTELIKLSKAREEFKSAGCHVVISSPEIVETCRDKLACYQHFARHNIDTPATWTPDELLQADRREFPCFMKPRFGSAGLGNYHIADLDDLRLLSPRVPNPIVQEFVEGTEHTLDAYAGLDGKLRCVVPRRRLEVRGGEVSKSLVVMDPQLIAVGEQVIASHDGWQGVITIQCIQTSDERARVIEVNPRFGGGVPLSIRAGADFPRWLLMEFAGETPNVKPEEFQDGLCMLRFDDSVFVDQNGRMAADSGPG